MVVLVTMIILKTMTVIDYVVVVDDYDNDDDDYDELDDRQKHELVSVIICHQDMTLGAVIYLGGLQPFFTVTKGVEKILVTMF